MCKGVNEKRVASNAGSRRRRLWELAHDCHCPVIGVCLPIQTLRKLLARVISSKVQLNDYDTHVGTVALCTQRSPISELLQDELDRRFALTIARFRQAKTIAALQSLWSDAVKEGDVAGAFWASLTHPCCDDALHESICRDIHMIQHQAGACTRADLARYTELQKRCDTQQEELERLQARHNRVVVEKTTELSRLSTVLMKTQASLVGKDTMIGALRQQLVELRADMPDLESRIRLKEKNTELAQRQQLLRAENEQLKQQIAALRLQRDDQVRPEAPEPKQASAIEPALTSMNLEAKTVLCVGGRTGSIMHYRKLIEDIGGRFAHHDGGLEDNANLLDANLAAADLVICQTGCIGHNAYWRVKEHCKRTGKQCVFVENPSASGLARGLRHISIKVKTNSRFANETIDATE